MWLCIKQADGRTFVIREEEIITVSMALGEDVAAVLTTDASRIVSTTAVSISAHHSIDKALAAMTREAHPQKCRVCGCVDEDCRQCIEKTGQPCYWVEPDLCSACDGEEWKPGVDGPTGDGMADLAAIDEAMEAAGANPHQAELDAVYSERNKLVALLASLYPSGIKRTAIPGWDEAWHGCVYIDLPTGQASWHYHDREAELFSHLLPYPGDWDGHTTEAKYERIVALAKGQHVVPAHVDQMFRSAD